MGQLSQLVLLAAIVASCSSNSILSIETNSSSGPSDSDLSELPTKFMMKLLASLSPEQHEALFVPIILTDSFLESRIQDKDQIPCRSHVDIRNYHRVRATDNEYYYVISNYTKKYQPVTHYSCDYNPNKCKPAHPRKFYGYCCHQHQKESPLYVIPLPARLLDIRDGHFYRAGTYDRYENYTIIQKGVMMNSYCGCDHIQTHIGKDYTCPNPNSRL